VEGFELAVVVAAPRRVSVSVAMNLVFGGAETRGGGLGEAVVVPHAEVLEGGSMESVRGQEAGGGFATWPVGRSISEVEADSGTLRGANLVGVGIRENIVVILTVPIATVGRILSEKIGELIIRASKIIIHVVDILFGLGASLPIVTVVEDLVAILIAAAGMRKARVRVIATKVVTTTFRARNVVATG
jgi:hypothetical protein